MLKRTVSVILAVLMLAGTAVPALADGTKRFKTYKEYLCLGDSVAAGCALTFDGSETQFGPEEEDVINFFNEEYVTYGFKFKAMPNAYHSIVANTLGAKLHQCAISGMRAVELRYLLQGVYNDPDPEYLWAKTIFEFADDDFVPYDLKKYVASYGIDYVEEVRNADIISINLGENDIFSSTMDAILAPFTEGSKESVQKIKDYLSDIKLIGTLINGMIGVGEGIGNLNETIVAFVREINKALKLFKENYSEILKTVYELNPDVTVVAVGLYNPLNNFRLQEGGWLKVSGILNTTVNDANSFLKSFRNEYDNFCYADVVGTELYEMNYDDPRMWDYFIAKVHPTIEGHRFMAEQILAALPSPEPLAFSDVGESFWAYDEIRYVVENGIMLGTSDKTFSPLSDMTRAQFITILYRLAGSPKLKGYTEPFSDVSDSFWAHDAIAWGYCNGIINGVSSDVFSPNTSISRQQLVTMLYRYEGCPFAEGELTVSDASKISDYASDAVIWALEKGIVTGYADNSFRPLNTATRAHMAAIISRYVQNENA